MTGVCKFFSAERRFGIIETEAGEYFFHASQLVGAPPARFEEVEFWLDDGGRLPGELVAVEVRARTGDMES